LLVDADESNWGVQRLVGVEEPVPLMESLGGKQAFKQKMSQVFPQGPQDLPFRAGTTLGQLRGDGVVAVDGIKLLVIGKINHFGEGCACSMGVLSKMVLGKLKLGPDDMVIVDTEAGVEHFGRRVDGECDVIIGVVDPTHESFRLARKMQAMALQAGAEIGFVLNKVTAAIEAEMHRQLDPARVVGSIPYQEALFLDGFHGRPVRIAVPAVDRICEWIEALH
jgi:CO dehydrogenase maturation factor